MLDVDGTGDTGGDRLNDPAYRLAVYQAGHALVARALGLKILAVKLLPRPPITITDKAFIHNNWDSFVDMLEARVVELFGGQMAELQVCGSHTCCTGDISRIDELTRLLAGLSYGTEYEDVFFHLEDVATRIFENKNVQAAIPPLAELLYAKEVAGEYEIPGEEIDAVIDGYLTPLPSKRKRSLFGLLKTK